MSFLTPWGLLAGLSIPVVIIYYLLKINRTSVTVSSNLLWDKVIEDFESKKPWQKIRNNLLLILQILILFLLSLTMSTPVIPGNIAGDEIIIVIDRSATMASVDKAKSRLDEAKELAMDLISNKKVSVISVDWKGQILQLKETDTERVKKSIMGITPIPVNGNIYEGIQMAYSIAEGDSKIFLLTDKNVEIEDDMVKIINFGGPNNNVGIIGLSYNIKPSGIEVLGQIKNYSNKTIEVTVTLSLEGNPFDIKKIIIEGEEIKHIRLTGIPRDIKKITMEISSSEDMLHWDNVFNLLVSEPYKNKILLVTTGNTFLENSLKVLNNIELYKTLPSDDLPLEEFNMVIFDGHVPKTLPDIHWMIVGPKEDNDLFKSAGKIEGTFMYPDPFNSLLSYTYLEDIWVKDGLVIETPHWLKWLVFDYKGNPLILYGEEGGKKGIIFTFDIRFSELPLRPGFPILMQNLCQWVLPSKISSLGSIASGEEIIIDILPTARSAYIQKPDGKIIEIAPPHPPLPFIPEEIGVHTLIQELSNGDVIREDFGVNYYYNNLDWKFSGEGTLPISEGFKGDTTLVTILVILALLFLVIEWLVYRHGIIL